MLSYLDGLVERKEYIDAMLPNVRAPLRVGDAVSYIANEIDCIEVCCPRITRVSRYFFSRFVVSGYSFSLLSYHPVASPFAYS